MFQRGQRNASSANQLATSQNDFEFIAFRSNNNQNKLNRSQDEAVDIEEAELSEPFDFGQLMELFTICDQDGDNFVTR